MVKRKQPRRKVSEPTRRKIATFYEADPNSAHICVITEKDVDVELHHLDENPSRSDIEYNILPLYSGLNKNIDKRETERVKSNETISH